MTHPPIDPRGPQFNAGLTSVVLAAVLATATTAFGPALLAVQVALFATAVVLGVQRTPAGYLFRRFIKPRLGSPAYLEDPRPPRFAQGLGLLFTSVGLVGLLAGPTWLGYAAVGAALVAALLNATVRICLGCKIYGICHLPENSYENTYTHPRNIEHKKEAIA
jgi:FtsH-binding integral membrane protein